MNGFSKHDWVTLFKGIGLSDEQMIKWHQLFESKHPDAHQSFLEWLKIGKNGIKQIRNL